jgi:ribose 5-phosphate isomerase A
MRKGQNSNLDEPVNWIPEVFRRAAQSIAKDATKELTDSKRDKIVVGLGSSPMAAAIIQEMGSLSYKEKIECIPSSTEIKSVAEHANLQVVDEIRIPEVEIVFDGADQIDSNHNIIKGRGDALLREKILHLAAKRLVVLQHILQKKLDGLYEGVPHLRFLKEGYPYVTENGNFILDTTFSFSHLLSDIENKEKYLKSIPGVLEVGLYEMCGCIL